MYHSKTLNCYNCKSVILSLSKKEVRKMNGLNFQCECCGHQNMLTSSKFSKSTNADPTLNIFSYENLIRL